MQPYKVCIRLFFHWHLFNEDFMRLSAPTTLVFIISLALAVFAVLPLLGVVVPHVGISSFMILVIAYVVLAAGVLLRKL